MPSPPRCCSPQIGVNNAWANGVAGAGPAVKVVADLQPCGEVGGFAEHERAGRLVATGDGANFVKVFLTSRLELNNLLAPGSTEEIGDDVGPPHGGSYYQGKKETGSDSHKTDKTCSNPNKLLYSPLCFAACYDATANPYKKTFQDYNNG